MFNNIFLKTLRDYFRQILIWGGGIGLVMLVYGVGYNSIFGTGPDRAKAVEDYRKTIESFTILTGKIYDIDTFGGFITAKIGSGIPILLGIWALLAGSGILRGEEERGNLDLLVSTPHTRISVLLQKWAGVVVAMLGIVFLSWVGLTLAAIFSQAGLSPVDGALAHLNWALIALVFGGLALLFSQLTTRKAAASWAGGLMAATYLLNNLVQNVAVLDWTKYIYPFYYASLSQPLARSVGTNWLGIIVLALLIVVFVGVALWMFLRRDLSGFFELFKSNKPVVSSGFRKIAEPQSPWLTSNFTFGFRAALPGAFIWGLGLSVYMLLILSVFDDIKGSMVDFLGDNDLFKQLGLANLTSNENILTLFIFTFMILFVAAYAVIQVASWTAEENEGRLELVLSTPEPRWRFLLAYFGVAVASSAVMIGLMGAIFALSTWAFNVQVNAGNAVAAFFGMWIVSVLIEAVGYVLAAFGPGWAVGVTAGLVVISYFSDLLGQALKLPEAALDLSVFRQYGHPLSEGLHWTPQVIMLVLSILFILVAVVRFRQRDIVR
jgi:ABC-2 type transport system permease protein